MFWDICADALIPPFNGSPEKHTTIYFCRLKRTETERKGEPVGRNIKESGDQMTGRKGGRKEGRSEWNELVGQYFLPW